MVIYIYCFIFILFTSWLQQAFPLRHQRQPKHCQHYYCSQYHCYHQFNQFGLWGGDPALSSYLVVGDTFEPCRLRGEGTFVNIIPMSISIHIEFFYLAILIDIAGCAHEVQGFVRQHLVVH